MVAIGFALIAASYRLREHCGHVLVALPYRLRLGWPLMHLFMHRGHRHGGRTPRPAADRGDIPR